MSQKAKASNVPIETLIVKTRDLNKRKRENRKARAVALRQANLAEHEVLDDALKLRCGDLCGKGKLNVGPELSSVFRGENADSRGGGCTGFKRQRHPSS